MVQNDFLKKNKLTAMQLARDFLIIELESQIKTINYYEKKLHVSRGTIQSAMTFLIEEGCITTHFRGHMGTLLVAKNQEKLWEYSGFGALVGAMEIPLNSLISGLATGICDCMKEKNIAFNCSFIQGSKTRINGLLKGRYDFIIASKLTEIAEISLHSSLETTMDLPECLYSRKYALLFSSLDKNEIEDGMTIALDPTSIDQVYLTNVLTKSRKNIKVIETTYINTRQMVIDGVADATVTRMDAVEGLLVSYCKEIKIEGFTPKEIEEFSLAVVVTSKENYGMSELLKFIMSPKKISVTQNEVIEELRVPSYY